MVKKILRFLHKEIPGIHEAAYLLGFFAICSQLLALVRDKLLAFTFGASSSLDLYYAAFRIPDFLFVTIGSLVSLSVVIPFLVSEYQKGTDKAREFIDTIFTFFLLAIIIVSAVAYVIAPYCIGKMFPGFDAVAQDTVVSVMRILLLSPILLGISNLFGSLTQSKNRFFVYSISPLLYNFGIIIGIIFFFPRMGLPGLALGVVLGAFLHLIVQIPTVIHLNLLPRITFKPKFQHVKEVTLLSFPRTLTLSMSHIAIFFIVSLASYMVAGSISIFSLAFNLQSVPLSVFAVSYSMAVFPVLSKLFASQEKEKFRNQFILSAQHILFWVVPSSVLFIVLRAHIVRIVFGAGQFDWSATRLTAATLALFAVSIVLQSLTLLFVRGLYAMGSTGKPFYITMVSGGVMVFLSYILVQIFDTFPFFRYFIESLLKIPDIPGTSVVMLALGFTMGTFLEGVWIWWLFAKSWKGITTPILRSFFRMFSASVIMGFVTFLSLRFFDQLFSLETFLGVFLQAVLSALCGVIVGIGILKLLQSSELADITQVLHHKFWKTNVISPDSELT